MKCLKCEKEIDNDSNFCSDCGERIEEKPTHIQVEDLIKMCSKVWYILGYLRGVNKDDKKSLEEFEKILRESHLDIWDWYNEVVDHMKRLARKNNEKDKKTEGSKRAGIPKTERVKAQQE